MFPQMKARQASCTRCLLVAEALIKSNRGGKSPRLGFLLYCTDSCIAGLAGNRSKRLGAPLQRIASSLTCVDNYFQKPARVHIRMHRYNCYAICSSCRIHTKRKTKRAQKAASKIGDSASSDSRHAAALKSSSVTRPYSSSRHD